MMVMTNLHTGTDGVIVSFLKHYIRSFGPSGGHNGRRYVTLAVLEVYGIMSLYFMPFFSGSLLFGF